MMWRIFAVLAVVAVTVMALAGCGGGEEEGQIAPTTSPQVSPATTPPVTPTAVETLAATPAPTPDITELEQAMSACSGHTWGTTEDDHLDWSLVPEAVGQQDYMSILEERKATLDNWESNLAVVNDYLLQRVSEAERKAQMGPIIDGGPPYAECLRKVLAGEAAPRRPDAGTSRSNPIPFRETGTAPPGWQITVLDVNGDGWPVIQAENRFNDPPEEGYRMVLITVQVTNVQAGDEPDSIGESDFELVGSRGEVYKTFQRSCGVTPNQLSAELFPSGTAEGTVCFQAGIDETDLLLIADIGFSFTEETRRYFALE